jgi:hypothetical protein
MGSFRLESKRVETALANLGMEGMLGYDGYYNLIPTKYYEPPKPTPTPTPTSEEGHTGMVIIIFYFICSC